YTSGYHGELDADTGEPIGRAPKMIYRGLLPLMEKHKITAYIAAHSHKYERCERNGLVHITTGGAGANLYGPGETPVPFSRKVAAAYHYCRVKVTPAKAVLEAVSVAPHPKSKAPRKSLRFREAGLILDRIEFKPRR
ncbi:MAG: hypothetical protein ACYS5V_11395, partial [Planctomycetota bacterium]